MTRALEVGYRHIDTARMYRNETEVGRALAASGIPREDVFVTTKMWPDRAGSERASIEESLEALGLDHVDLWLIHWPPGGARPDVWERFLEAQVDGLARAVGVSNYSVAQLDELEQATGRLPSVNQIEWSPALYDARHARRASPARRAARGLQPAEDDRPPQPPARRDRRSARRDSRAGRDPLAPRARDRRDPEVGERESHRARTRTCSASRSARTRSRLSTRSGRARGATEMAKPCRRGFAVAGL